MTNFFRLLTINTWKCDGNYRQRLTLLKSQLSALQPDVIAAQEVFRVNGADTGRELANALDMHYAFAPARRKVRLFEGQLTDSESGLGILSKVPILKTDMLPLSPHPDDIDRLAQLAWLNVNGISVLIINTHLTHLRGQSELRKQQISTLLGHPALTNPDSTVFLCGDFNAEAHSPEIQFLLNHPAVSVRNAYQLGHGNQPGYTMPDRTGNQLNSGRCIDFIFLVTSASQLPVVINEARVVLDVPDKADNYPSDHFGVMITAQLP
ncbi:endonuclease/exonuclease/phosphatase family protein [Spirosoma arcticum]